MTVYREYIFSLALQFPAFINSRIRHRIISSGLAIYQWESNSITTIALVILSLKVATREIATELLDLVRNKSKPLELGFLNRYKHTGMC